MPGTVRLIGPGRAGSSLARALSQVGWEVRGVLGRQDDPSAAAEGVDVLLVCTPDAAVGEVAGAVSPVDTTAVLHVSGSLGLEPLAGHARPGSLHPLVPLPDATTGASRLLSGAWFAVAGDPVAQDLAAAMGGRAVGVGDADRARYHAAACIASNHLVALMGQVERVASGAGLPLATFLPLARASLDDVAARGPRGALTGPVARGDQVTVEGHRRALDLAERPAYDALAELARRLAGRRMPAHGGEVPACR